MYLLCFFFCLWPVRRLPWALELAKQVALESGVRVDRGRGGEGEWVGKEGGRGEGGREGGEGGGR